MNKQHDHTASQGGCGLRHHLALALFLVLPGATIMLLAVIAVRLVARVLTTWATVWTLDQLRWRR